MDELQSLIPPPLDPMFASGGTFDGYNEDVIQIIGVIILLAVLDLTVVAWMFSAKSRYVNMKPGYHLNIVALFVVCFCLCGKCAFWK